jgi:hypothetical protein
LKGRFIPAQLAHPAIPLHLQLLLIRYLQHTPNLEDGVGDARVHSYGIVVVHLERKYLRRADLGTIACTAAGETVVKCVGAWHVD